MGTAYFVYLFALILVVSLSYNTKLRGESYTVFRWDVLVPVILISFLMGMRYEVGIDWENYKEYYEEVKRGSDLTNSGIEPAYFFLNQCIAWLQLPYQFFFFVIMLLHLLLLYKSFDQYLFLLSLGIYFYFTTIFFTSLNIQRQTLSFCVFLFSLRYFTDRKWIPYFLCIACATLIHYSSVILFPLYFVGSKYFIVLDKKWLQLILYVFSFFTGVYILNFILNELALYITGAKYLNTIKALGSKEMEVNTGIGLITTTLVDVCLILYASKLSKVYYRFHFHLLFRIFFIGILLSNALGLDVFLSRVPFALVALRFLMLAFWVYYLLNIKNTLIAYCLGIFILLLYFGMFVLAIFHGHTGCSPFQFV